MALTITHTALVRAIFHGDVSSAQIRHWLSVVEGLVVAGTPFFFIANTLPDTRFSQDYRAIQAVWYKQHKAAFRTHCQGLVRIATSPAEQQRLDTPALHAAWGVPYFVTTDSNAGFHWITQQLQACHAR